ncbi:hypothetical protein JOL62DRAFT_271246 [Phyllosticta paracitricarpa]|uniref:Uncharacterized protein n=1 Tax=Phyllosticta paracitricarpa TaxID=2016321 RepID=A0ABR1MWZ7_9PEZI
MSPSFVVVKVLSSSTLLPRLLLHPYPSHSFIHQPQPQPGRLYFLRRNFLLLFFFFFFPPSPPHLHPTVVFRNQSSSRAHLSTLLNRAAASPFLSPHNRRYHKHGCEIKTMLQQETPMTKRPSYPILSFPFTSFPIQSNASGPTEKYQEKLLRSFV